MKRQMTDSHSKQVSSAVNQTISTYQLTSKSKSYRRLSQNYSKRITKEIIDRKQDLHLLELIKKRDYYTKKIHELLHECGEETEPHLIVYEAEAEHYIRKRLLRDAEKTQSIRNLIQKHKQFQENSAKAQNDLILKYSEKTSTYGGLKKLQLVNAAANAKNHAEKDARLFDFYKNLSQAQRVLNFESENLLRQLNIPFFNRLPDQSLPTQDQRLFVLNLLFKTLG